MNNCEKFLDYFDWLVSNCKEPVILPTEIKDFYNMLRSQEQYNTKPILTESGLQILEFLQKSESKNYKAKDIADGMLISSRKVSGAIRKLVTDDFVGKFGSNPVVYTLTDKGKNFNIEQYKGELNNEEDN